MAKIIHERFYRWGTGTTIFTLSAEGPEACPVAMMIIHNGNSTTSVSLGQGREAVLALSEALARFATQLPETPKSPIKWLVRDGDVVEPDYDEVSADDCDDFQDKLSK